jgi:hypothetical protein
MVRLIMSMALGACLTLGSIGCCTTCGKGCAGCDGKYWRNKGSCEHCGAGHFWCRTCDLCDNVGGPCGLWSQTSSGGGCATCGEEVIYESAAAPVKRRVVHASTPVMSQKTSPKYYRY